MYHLAPSSLSILCPRFAGILDLAFFSNLSWTPVATQILLMCGEVVCILAPLLFLFHVRRRFGSALVYIVFGVIFQYSALLALSVYVQLTPAIVVSPGSVVVFPAVLFLVLLVYISEDVIEARKLIYGIAAANVILLPLGLLVAWQMQSPLAINPYHLAPALFVEQPRLVVVSALTLYLDTMLICLLYEFVSRYTRSLFARIYMSFTIILWFDAAIFVTGAFAGNPAYGAILYSHFAGKTLAALVYASVLAVYLQYCSKREVVVSNEGRRLSQTFMLLTYRQRYEELQKMLAQDALTKIYNRRFFDEVLEKQISQSERSNRPISLMMLDVDHFKRINDVYGHAEGDLVLQMIASFLVKTMRSSDYVCRYGGEEFGIILPDADLDQAVSLGQRLVANLPQACSSGWAGAGKTTVTATIGIASFPYEASNSKELVRLADHRLYEGKRSGRNRVVAGAEVALGA